MSTPTVAQAEHLQAMLADVEIAYQSLLRARQAINVLARAGALKCGDVRGYNLQSSAVWAYQSAAARLARAAGSQMPPIPDPVYITWKGITGDRASDIDCNTTRMSGALFGAQRLVHRCDLGAAISPDVLEWRSGPSASDEARVQAMVGRGQQAALAGLAGAGLGALPLLAAWAIGVAIAGVGVWIVKEAIVSIIEAFHDTPGKREATKQLGIQATQNTAVLKARADCYTDCTGRGVAPAQCTSSCEDLHPPFDPETSGTGFGIVGKAVGIAVVGLVAFAGWKYIDKRMQRSGGDELLSGGVSARRLAARAGYDR